MFNSSKGVSAPKHYNESNDCTVRALANASGKSYEDCHSIMKSLGRVNGQMFDCRKAASGMMKAGGKLFITERLDDYRLLQGNYVVFVQQHCYCLKDGEIIDTIKPSSGSKLLGVFKF